MIQVYQKTTDQISVRKDGKTKIAVQQYLQQQKERSIQIQKQDWSVAGAGKGTGDLGNGFLCDELAGDNGFKRLQDCWFCRQ